jgi:hypothetical protein
MDRLRAVYTAAFFAESRGLGMVVPLLGRAFAVKPQRPQGCAFWRKGLTAKARAERHALRPANPRPTAILCYALVGSGTHGSCRCAAMSELGAETPNRVPQPYSRRPELTALRGSTTLRGARQTGRLPPAARENSHLFCLEERAQHLLSA